MIFATDLDNTMIFSYRLIEGYKDIVSCVEYYNLKPITYMTYSAIEKIKKIADKIYVIPTTTRSISQFMRVELFSCLKFAIVDNGGTILQNGNIDKTWEKYIENILGKYDFEYVLNVLDKLPSITLKPRIIDGKFVFTKSENIDLCKKILFSKIDKNKWQLSFHGPKIYIVPIEITKKKALSYLNEQVICNNELIICAGDSNLDLSMLEYSDYGLISHNCELSNLKNDNLIQKGYGLNSADEILDFVSNLLSI